MCDSLPDLCNLRVGGPPARDPRAAPAAIGGIQADVRGGPRETREIRARIAAFLVAWGGGKAHPTLKDKIKAVMPALSSHGLSYRSDVIWEHVYQALYGVNPIRVGIPVGRAKDAVFGVANDLARLAANPRQAERVYRRLTDDPDEMNDDVRQGTRRKLNEWLVNATPAVGPDLSWLAPLIRRRMVELKVEENNDLWSVEITRNSELIALVQAASEATPRWVHPEYGPIESWFVGSMKDMSSVFEGVGEFDRDLSDWDVSGVESMRDMFVGATNFTGTGLEFWDTSSLTDARGMFHGATAFDADLGAWDVGRLRNGGDMFRGATTFRGLGLQDWNVWRLKDVEAMFATARHFNANLAAWGPRLFGEDRAEGAEDITSLVRTVASNPRKTRQISTKLGKTRHSCAMALIPRARSPR